MMGFNKKKESYKYITGIVLRQESGHVLIIKKDTKSNISELIDEREFKYSNGWENLTYDIDEVLFTLEKSHNFSLKKTIFFVYSHLVDRKSGDIKDSYLEKINSLVKENQLDPEGYIEYGEAIAKYFQYKEQSPLTALVVEIDTPAITASIYKGGERVFSETVGKTENIASDLEEICKKSQKNTVLPSRIIMYDSSELENESTSIITHKWSEELFIQIPKVEVLKPDEVLQALVHSFNEYSGNPNPLDQKPIDSNSSSSPKEEQLQKITGFVINEDIKESETYIHNEHIAEDNTTSSFEKSSVEEDAIQQDNQDNNDQKKQGGFNIKMIIANFFRPIMNINMKGKSIGLFGLGLVVVIGFIIAILFFLHKAELTIYYQEEKIEKEIEMSKGLPIKKLSQKITASETVETTGVKNIGEKAQGEVTIFNAEITEKVIKKNTQLKTSEGLIFLLTSDVKVSPAEKTITDGGDILTTTSKTKAKAEAQEIGTKYNIKNDIKFAIEGSSESQGFARSTGAFSGGTEEEIEVVSREDYEDVKKKVDSVIKKEGEKVIKSKQTDGKIISKLTEINVTNEKFSTEIGEEAKNVKLQVTAEVSFYSYNDPDMKNLLLEQLTSSIPDGYTLSPKNISYTISDASQDDKKNAVLTIDIVAEPKLNIEERELFNSIKGKGVNAIRSIVENKFNAKGYRITFNPPLPVLNLFVPLFSQNLKISVEPL